MLEGSQFLETLEDGAAEPEKLKERIGYRDPPVGISLFSGVGGFDMGMENAGFDVRVMVEQDEQACETMRRNMPDFFCEHTEPEIIQDDIREVSTEQILDAADLQVGEATAVFGGPPCQGFSMAGERDPGDERNELYQEMVRVVNEAEPVFFVMENVKGLASMQDGEVIQNVCRQFQQCGYHVKWDVLDAADFGVPQHRERVFIIGKRVDVMAFPSNASRPQMHIAAKPGKIHHPDFFREKYGIQDPEQTGLDSFTSEPESVDELLEQMIEDGGESL